MVFGTKAVLSRCSQNNDGDEGDDEAGETTIRDFASDKIVIGEVKRMAKKWLDQDGYNQICLIFRAVFNAS